MGRKRKLGAAGIGLFWLLITAGTGFSGTVAPEPAVLDLLKQLQSVMEQIRHGDRSGPVSVPPEVLSRADLLVGVERSLIEAYLGTGTFAPYWMKDFCKGGFCRMYQLFYLPPNYMGGCNYLFIKYDDRHLYPGRWICRAITRKVEAGAESAGQAVLSQKQCSSPAGPAGDTGSGPGHPFFSGAETRDREAVNFVPGQRRCQLWLDKNPDMGLKTSGSCVFVSLKERGAWSDQKA